MTVTKQQQLERISRLIPKWNDAYKYAELMTNPSINMTVYQFTDNPSGDNAFITRAEWYQERDKMSSKPEVDNSWRERGELPPVGCECEVFDGDDWLKSFIVWRSRSGDVVVQTRNGYFEASHAKFRPLRTEREKAIDEMMSLVMDGLMSHEMARELVIKLHYAGYRKVKP